MMHSLRHFGLLQIVESQVVGGFLLSGWGELFVSPVLRGFVRGAVSVVPWEYHSRSAAVVFDAEAGRKGRQKSCEASGKAQYAEIEFAVTCMSQTQTPNLTVLRASL